MTVQQWSTVPSSNNSAPPTGAPEGQSPGSVNNVLREIMASVAIEAQVNRVKYLNSVAGTNTVTGSMTPALTAYSAGMQVVFTPAATNTGAVTLNINGLGALDVLKGNGQPLIAGDLVVGVPVTIVLDSGADDFFLIAPSSNDAATGVTNVTASTGTTNIDLSLGPHFVVTLNASTTLTFSNPPVSGRAVTYTFWFIQDATGSRTVTWPATVKHSDDLAPVLTTTANKMDACAYTTYDGGTKYRGGQIIANMTQ